MYMYVCIYTYTHTCTYIFIYMTLTHGMTFWAPEFHTSNLYNPGQKFACNNRLSLTQTWNEILADRILQNPFCYKLATCVCTVRALPASAEPSMARMSTAEYVNSRVCQQPSIARMSTHVFGDSDIVRCHSYRHKTQRRTQPICKLCRRITVCASVWQGKLMCELQQAWQG